MKKVLGFLAVFLLCMAGIIAVKGDDFTWSLPTGGTGDVFLENSPGIGLSLDLKLSVLEGLGFQFSQEERAAMEEWPEAGYGDLLALVGWGEYDYDTWEWSPTSDQVYALDTEVFNIEQMYPDFFRGLLAISGGELPITNVVQDDSEVDWEEGTGTFRITLDYDEKEYSFTAVAMYDWLDVGVLGQVNEMLKEEGVEKRFYATWNSLQGITVVFQDKDWVRRFEGETGCKLHTKL